MSEISSEPIVYSDGLDFKIGVTPEWEVLLDDSKVRFSSPKSTRAAALITATFIEAINDGGFVDRREAFYRRGLETYHSLREREFDTIPNLEEESPKLGSFLSNPLETLAGPKRGLLAGRLICIKLNPVVYSVVFGLESKADTGQLNELAGQAINGVGRREVMIEQVRKRLFVQGFDIGTDTDGGVVSTQASGVAQDEKAVVQRQPGAATTENQRTGEIERQEAGPGPFNDISEYSRPMYEHILEQEEPFKVDALINWARKKGWKPHRGQVERILLLELERRHIVRKVIQRSEDEKTEKTLYKVVPRAPEPELEKIS